MSGKALQAFVTNYRAEDAEKLTARMKNGLSSCKYKPAEYERLQAIIDAKRLESDLIGQKVLKTRCTAKATKESSTLRQHRQVWSCECPRLQKAEEKAEDDLHDFLETIKPSDRTDTGIFSLQDYALLLEGEREEFRKASVEPVHHLKDNLAVRLREVQHQQPRAFGSDWDQVVQQIHFVKSQQEDVTAKLHAEYQSTEEEIIVLGLEKYLTSTSDNQLITENLPEEVLDSDCPYPELKESLIQAFQSLSERYQSRQQSLQEHLQTTDRFCGWPADEHQRFQFCLSLYAHPDVPNSRALCMDMLQKLFPQRSKQELMAHERVWDWWCFTQAQLKVLTQQWQRDHEELLARALVTLQEATRAHQEEQEHQQDRQHQQDICSQLRRKLQQWRAQQEEVAKLEADIAARQREEEEARLKREQERESAVRARQKEKVRQFYLKQQERRDLLEQRDQERLANLRRVMAEQARRDKERVQFRAEMLRQRQEEREERELEQQREEEEKQHRLEVLRKQVEVVAEADPERMMADTKAWRSRFLNFKEFELQRPLYSINTYTDTQIVSDPRVRVEQALREAGLHHSRYAKEVLSIIQPPKPPRPDTKSIIKF
ncbi:coiled-coil domain-containing protein 148-like [Cheilinus undulatus]|uniref:coiled-coil domain-containing protein 148-like n=1 Tax=Cheilinus undulatus TaxID=241271 RepID=UPI001BD3259C|nr:coiled-coil domain-containing protein 148-like [Cheilinus undulatus]